MTSFTRYSFGLLGLSFFAAASAGVCADSDGPYVMLSSDGSMSAWYADSVSGGDFVKRTELAQVGKAVAVAAVADRPAFSVPLRPPGKVEPAEESLVEGVCVFILADTHGEFQIATELLMKQNVINNDLKWSFGKGVLVVTGDVFDRGPNHTEIFWLLYKLEAEAASVGGRVHLLLGNHETMVLTGSLDYLNLRYNKVASALWVANYSELWSPDSLLGQWLRTKPTVLKIGKVLCMHGGISADVVEGKWTLGDINANVRAWLNEERDKSDPKVAFLTGPTGPLWYRGYFPKYRIGGHGAPQDVEAAKKWFGVDRIAVGHTIVDTVTPLYDGSVIAVQVYPTKDGKTGKMNMEGVYIDEQGTWHKAKIDGSREILRDDTGNPIRNGVATPATSGEKPEPKAEEKPAEQKKAA